ncbi:ATP-binding protein [Nocardioides sp.]|uniref:ATP-binding protein n=1 Tax=Nocardioides sp. TaxID=35761 RepID=UPI002CABB858|nr:ATP-binding protein [Nocardioides sp.]HXH80407.1 ATP-binding protein [Nocardioides sp.]
MTSILKRNRIGLIDGPPGTGKTTFAQWAAERCGRPSAVAAMPENPAPNDFLRVSIVAVTGQNPDGHNKTEMEAELVAALADWKGLLILDEIQNVGLRGLTEARYIHDTTRPQFPLLLVGWGASKTVRENQPLSERIRQRRFFKPLKGADLFTTVRAIDERFIGVPDDVIRYADDRYAQGLLRRWVALIETLQDWEVEHANEDDLTEAITSITEDEDEDEDDAA